MSILWIRRRRRKIISVFVGWTAVLTTFKVFQIKFFYALPEGYKQKSNQLAMSLVYSRVAIAIQWPPWFESSIGEWGFIIIKNVKELGLRGPRRRKCFGANSGCRSRSQLVVSRCRQSLLGCWICWFQTLSNTQKNHCGQGDFIYRTMESVASAIKDYTEKLCYLLLLLRVWQLVSEERRIAIWWICKKTKLLLKHGLLSSGCIWIR